MLYELCVIWCTPDTSEYIGTAIGATLSTQSIVKPGCISWRWCRFITQTPYIRVSAQTTDTHGAIWPLGTKLWTYCFKGVKLDVTLPEGLLAHLQADRTWVHLISGIGVKVDRFVYLYSIKTFACTRVHSHEAVSSKYLTALRNNCTLSLKLPNPILQPRQSRPLTL